MDQIKADQIGSDEKGKINVKGKCNLAGSMKNLNQPGKKVSDKISDQATIKQPIKFPYDKPNFLQLKAPKGNKIMKTIYCPSGLINVRDTRIPGAKPINKIK